jgi:conjugal transfer pilus assembly protein TraV
MNCRQYIPILLLHALAGCAGSMSGLDGSDKLSCPVTQGVSCKPMSQVYEESAKANQPTELTQSVEAGRGSVEPKPLPVRGTTRMPPGAENGPVPLRTRPNVMRIWIAPWEDADGDLHEGAWIAMRLDDGGWNIEHVRERIREGYGAALVPPPVQESKPAAQSKSSSGGVDVADVLPKNLLPGSKAPAAPFFDTNAD